MEDNQCGPSNPLQSFTKHTSVDRSLQHDRLALRQTPIQQFRTSTATGSTRADAEFQAFQSGSPYATPAIFPNYSIPPAKQHAPSTPLSNWSSEFQRLSLGDERSRYNVQRPSTHLQPATTNPSAWHREFLMSQPDSNFQDLPLEGEQFGLPRQASLHHGNSHLQYALPPTTRQQPQPIQSAEERAEQDLFSKEFDLVQLQVDSSESKGKERERTTTHEPSLREQTPSDANVLSHADPLMGDISGDFDYDRDSLVWSEDVNVVDQLRTMRRDGGWEALAAFERAHRLELEKSNSPLSQDIVNNIQKLRQEEAQEETSLAEGSASTQSAFSATYQPTNIKIGADAIPSSQQRAKPPSAEAEADELAKTAAKLLHRMRDESSSKFQQSSFMELMRQLRDREARVEGDNLIKQEPHPGGKYYPSDAFVNPQD